jgi:hypothetical protein
MSELEARARGFVIAVVCELWGQKLTSEEVDAIAREVVAALPDPPKTESGE